MKKPKVFNVWSKIRSALRKVWLYSPQRRNALSAAKTDTLYFCVLCQKVHEKWAMEVDHIEPCGALTSLDDVRGFVDRLFNGKLQAICKPCHKAKPKGKVK